MKKPGLPELALHHERAFKRLDDESRDVAASVNTTLVGAQFDFANQELEIARLNAARLEQSIEIAQASMRQRLIIFFAIGAILLLSALGAVARYRSMRRARNLERSANEKLSRVNISLQKAERDLTRALAAAQAASNAKTAFLNNMSHELRTPLNAVIGFADILRNQSHGPLGSPEYLEYAERITESGGHLLSLVAGLLRISSIDPEGCQTKARSVPVGEVVEEAIESMEPHSGGQVRRTGV